MRNFTKTLAVVSLLAPASAQPLGIGDIKLHSALNQKLNAEIGLIVSAAERTSDILVRLAPPEKFDEAGVPWSYFLSQIKFDTVIQPNGSVIVKLSSNEALREPFLDFLLEVSWDKGSIYREFTVLVDPPATYTQPVIPVVQKEKQPEQVVRAVQDKPVEKAEPVAAVENTAVSAYGPTSRKDTLWKIAEKVRPSGDVSIEQMMIAIYEANPRAFYKDNVNALMSGETLDIPDSEAVLKMSNRQAIKQFKNHNNVWRAKAKVAKAEKPVVTADAQIDSQLELVAPVESDVTDDVVVTPEIEQGVEASVAEESDKTIDTPEDRAVSDSEADAKAVEQSSNLELQARLEKLEQQIEMMQKLLVLKDQQLAAIQNQNKIAEVETVKPVEEVKPDSQASIEAAKPEQKTAVKPTPEVKTPKTTKPAPVAEPESSFFADTYYLIIGGLGVVLLGILGWLWWRKRKVEEETDTESMFVNSSEIRMPDSEENTSVASLEDSSVYDVGTVGESSFLSEFTPSDFDAFDTDQNEVDPISEADVYLAYGRYQQAEDLMRQAIEDQPDRNECKLKLLEIFYANENKDAFEQYTSELADAGMHKDQSFWAKVLDMANEIIPDSKILASSEPAKANFDLEMTDSEELAQQSESESNFKDSDKDVENLQSDISGLDELEIDSTDLKLDADDSENLDLDFDLSAFSDTDGSDISGEKEDSSAEGLETIEFDPGSFSAAESETTNAIEKPEIPDKDEDIESFDFNSGADKEADDDSTELKLDIDEDDEQVLESFDFSSMLEPTETKVKTTGNKAEESVADDFDFDFDFDEASLSEAGSSEQEQIEVSDLTDMDEFETKIDLAKAYVDMGDAEAAKAIAEEVLEKGSDQQKQSAQELLDELK